MNRLRDVRQRKRLTQAKLASLAGLTSATISRYETGKHKLSVEKARQIAQALDISWKELFDESEVEKEVQVNDFGFERTASAGVSAGRGR